MKTVLIIDDDHALRHSCAQLLENNGWQVLEAGDGDCGLNLALAHQPQVVLCDLRMPRCNGYKVCRTLRTQESPQRRTHIVVTTGSGFPEDRKNAMEAGADEYLVKPIEPRFLIEVLNRLVSTGNPIVMKNKDTAGNNGGEHPTKIRFWGVRGSIPVPGTGTVHYGGNTSCLEVRADGELIILDAGTGIRPLGLSLMAECGDNPRNITLLVTHTHWDHIQGFPFFTPAYRSNFKIRVLGFEGARKGLEGTLSDQMESPYFPITMQEMMGHISIEELKDMEFSVGPVQVKAEFVHHPGICVGFRLTTRSGVICHIPDVELCRHLRRYFGGDASPTSVDDPRYTKEQLERLLRFVQGADVLVLDSQYSAAEYESHVGWGHSCVEDAVALAAQTGVKRLILFHHDPQHDDAEVTRLLDRARELVALHGDKLQVDAAREGAEISLPTPKAVKKKAVQA